MKYVWIVLGGIFYLMWLIASVVDVVDRVKDSKRHLQTSTGLFIAIHILGLFLWSFFTWLIDFCK